MNTVLSTMSDALTCGNYDMEELAVLFLATVEDVTVASQKFEAALNDADVSEHEFEEVCDKIDADFRQVELN